MTNMTDRERELFRRLIQVAIALDGHPLPVGNRELALARQVANMLTFPVSDEEIQEALNDGRPSERSV